ncbi:MAG TPA: hypothetical protein DCP68_04460 [Ruminococcus sp.]|nr:hypothetical protein [Ruminococcus sp.]
MHLTDLLTPHSLLLLTAALSLLWMLREYLRRRTKAAAFFLGTLSGIAALLICHFFGAAFGFVPPLTVWTAAVSAVAGIPGVVLLAVIDLLKL